jgi:hypothetical protein
VLDKNIIINIFKTNISLPWNFNRKCSVGNRGVAKAVEHLPYKHKILSLNPILPSKKMKKENALWRPREPLLFSEKICELSTQLIAFVGPCLPNNIPIF